MKNVLLISSMALFAVLPLSAQKYVAKNGHIRFFSETPAENIEAHNRQVNAALDLSNGALVFKVLIKSFEFEKALMQEHFNENYMESDQFPNATFNGKLSDPLAFSKASKGPVKVTLEGDLTIHGVTRKVKETATLEWKGEDVSGQAKFIVKPADYNIRIPAAVANNIAKEIEVSVDVNLKAL
ncbi:MAG TPA: YceI family protein [Bacteroidales bacterium]|nr:YceI family protein [Bacteroidales bacterium]